MWGVWDRGVSSQVDFLLASLPALSSHCVPDSEVPTSLVFPQELTAEQGGDTVGLPTRVLSVALPWEAGAPVPVWPCRQLLTHLDPPVPHCRATSDKQPQINECQVLSRALQLLSV